MCPVSAIPSGESLGDNYLLAIFFIFTGTLFVTQGNRLFPVIVFLFGFLATIFYSIQTLYTTFLNESVKTWIFYTVVASLTLASTMIGVILVKLGRLDVAVLSGASIFYVGILINEIWLYNYDIQTQMSIFIGMVTFTCFCLGLKWSQIAIIITTSLFGSYLKVRGTSIFTTSFSAEIIVIRYFLGKRR